MVHVPSRPAARMMRVSVAGIAPMAIWTFRLEHSKGRSVNSSGKCAHCILNHAVLVDDDRTIFNARVSLPMRLSGEGRRVTRSAAMPPALSLNGSGFLPDSILGEIPNMRAAALTGQEPVASGAWKARTISARSGGFSVGRYPSLFFA